MERSEHKSQCELTLSDRTERGSRRGHPMCKITVVLGFAQEPYFHRLIEQFLAVPLVAKALVIAPEDPGLMPAGCEYLEGPAPTAGAILHLLLEKVDTPYLLFLQPGRELQLGPGALERLTAVADTTGAGLVYSDYDEILAGERREHPVNDYQPGSIREEFDFGGLTLFSRTAVQHSLRKWGAAAGSARAGIYDLRLKVSVDYPLYHVREYLYAERAEIAETGLFAYVDPGNYLLQKELEEVATKHLQRIGAYLKPVFAALPPPGETFPVLASIVIPVRNREHTIAEAVQSALTQETDFPFNVLVVDNHSTDGTTAILTKLAGKSGALRHIIPSRRDLNIGGCWNEAVFSPFCGRFAVQLDSDDLYASPRALRELVQTLLRENYAMVIGSYTLVNGQLEEIPPGLIDHREWTEDNGRNNALRINGLGAPRAFSTEILRRMGFLNVGYGEDYDVALRISRHYRIGRIYDSLYLCRRWGGNSDAALTIVQKNRYDAFKDQIRSLEILARQKMNGD